MKKLFAIALLSVGTLTVNAQNASNQTTSATQAVDLLLSNVIDIEFTSNGTTTGPLVQIPFTTINDYVNGVETASQEIRVRSNKNFKVDVKTNSASFTYIGSAAPTPVMPVSDVLGMKVTANATGGTFDGPYSSAAYYTLREFDQLVLLNCNAGANQTFSVAYRATPGFVYPAGAYSINVIYTATQL